MTEEIIINLLFNEKIERDNQNFYFKYVWKKIFKNWLKITITAIVFLFLGFYPIKDFDTNLMYYFFRYGGIFAAGYSLILIKQYFNSNKNFKKEVEKIIEGYKALDSQHSITLNEYAIEFKNPLMTINSAWINTSYIISGDYILVSPIKSLNFIIHKSEVNDQNFETIINFLHKKSNTKK